jgi:hypothetical protein
MAWRATNVAGSSRVGGFNSDREGGRFRVRCFVLSWRWRTTREVLAAGDAEPQGEPDLRCNTRTRSFCTGEDVGRALISPCPRGRSSPVDFGLREQVGGADLERGLPVWRDGGDLRVVARGKAWATSGPKTIRVPSGTRTTTRPEEGWRASGCTGRSRRGHWPRCLGLRHLGCW